MLEIGSCPAQGRIDNEENEVDIPLGRVYVSHSYKSQETNYGVDSPRESKSREATWKSGLIMYWSLSHDSIKTGGKRQTRAWTSLFPLGFVSIPRFPSSLTSESRCPPPRFGRKSLELWNGPVHVYKKKGRSKRGGMSKRKREGKKRQRTATKKAKACMLGNEHKR